MKNECIKSIHTLVGTSNVQVGENGTEVTMEHDSTVTNSDKQDTGDEDKLSEEEIKLLSTVKENPTDFSSWTTLLQLVEQKVKVVKYTSNIPSLFIRHYACQSKLGPAREVFDAFLKVYPYCYGYWKKFADLEKKLSSSETAREVMPHTHGDAYMHTQIHKHSYTHTQVYERGVQAVPLSVDLWIHYVNLTAGENPEGKEAIRRFILLNQLYSFHS